MTSPQVSELSSKKELPFIFLSLPAREQAIIHMLLPKIYPLMRMIKTNTLRAVKQ
jgi:hypothetical protein